ncbi:MAG: RagB/SusD family nutrient uptake outer membrane protein [Bacteroidota bacterium]
MKNRNKITIIFSILLIGLGSCTKWTEIKPEGFLLEGEAVKSGQDVIKIVNSTYDALANRLNGNAQIYSDLLGDELADYNINGDRREMYTRGVIAFNATATDNYRGIYRCVFRANTCLDYIQKFNDLTETQKSTLEGELKFIRALSHFEIAKLYAHPKGSSPLIDGNKTQSGIPLRKKVSIDPVLRSTINEMYSYIEEDLLAAISLLPNSNPANTTRKVYADKIAAKALLAKVYFQSNQYQKAIDILNDVLSDNAYQLSDSLNHFDNASFSKEYLFQFVSTGTGDNRAAGYTGNYRSDNVAVPNMQISKLAYDYMNQDTTDKRLGLIKVINKGKPEEVYGSKKFDYDFFDVPYLLLTDMYLMRAEALAITNQNLTTAATDVNKIISRSYITPAPKLLTGAELPDVIKAKVRDERRREFLLEGDRIQSFKRIGANGETQTPNTIRNAEFNCNGLVFAFPQTEVTIGFTQNPTQACN